MLERNLFFDFEKSAIARKQQHNSIQKEGWGGGVRQLLATSLSLPASAGNTTALRMEHYQLTEKPIYIELLITIFLLCLTKVFCQKEQKESTEGTQVKE